MCNAKEEEDEDGATEVDKRLKDKRFMKTERAILRAFFGAKRRINTKKLAARAKISRSTFYRHHRNLQRVLPDVEKWLIEEFGEEAEKMSLAKRVKVRFLYYRLLSFIYRRRREFEAILERGDVRTIEKMVNELLPAVGKRYGINREGEEAIRVYEKEVAGVVETWILEDFSTSEKGVLKDMMYLTRTARERLGALGKH